MHIYSEVFNENKELSHLKEFFFMDKNNQQTGFEEREKYEKLTINQIVILKEIMSTLSMKMNDISAKYKVSYSVLNKIKQKSFDETVKNKASKINKIYGTRNVIIIDLIKYYILTN